MFVKKFTELLACKTRPVLKCVAALREIVLHNMIKEQDLISYILVLVFWRSWPARESGVWPTCALRRWDHLRSRLPYTHSRISSPGPPTPAILNTVAKFIQCLLLQRAIFQYRYRYKFTAIYFWSDSTNDALGFSIMIRALKVKCQDILRLLFFLPGTYEQMKTHAIIASYFYTYICKLLLLVYVAQPITLFHWLFL